MGPCGFDWRRLALACLASLCCFVAVAVKAPAGEVTVFEPPGQQLRPTTLGDRPVLINGRTLTPAGKHIKTQSYSWGLAVSPDETSALLISSSAIQFITLDPLSVAERLVPFHNPTKRKSDLRRRQVRDVMEGKHRPHPRRQAVDRFVECEAVDR